jgi:ABC-type transport system involved in cytochrome c biogenesis permease subunit
MKNGKETPSGKPAKSANKPAWTPVIPATGMRRWLPWVITIVFAGWALGNLAPRKDKSPFHISEFAKLPVLLEGRVQPLDSVARNTLLLIRGKSTVAIEPEGSMSGMERMFKTKRMPAIEWLLEMMTRPDTADTRKVFRIDNTELKSMLKVSDNEKFFSFEELRKDQDAFEAFFKESQRLARAAENKTLEPEQRSAFEKAVMRLHGAMSTYIGVQNSLEFKGTEDFAADIAAYEKAIPGGLAAMRSGEDPKGNNDVVILGRALQMFERLEGMAYPMVIPPTDPANKDGWRNIGASLKEAMREGGVHPAAKAYAIMATGYGKNQPDVFNAAVTEYRDNYLKGKFDKELKKGREEWFFNHYEFFIKALTIYIVALLFGCAFWFTWGSWLRTTGVALATLAFIIHTSGLIFRMHLEGRPPVTNLYSSAIFIGFAAVALGLLLERIFKDGIGLVTASVVGFATLVIAHNLSLDGDTMKLLQAVLDTNIWLATHVVAITLGYSAMFLAGALATKYILRGVFSKNLTPVASKRFTQMVYGIVCFATLFSFVGTVLGGIWADQSWGRFWGWDPKENGALMIVIWCAVILHARWGGMIRERGLMAMAIFGNIVTAYSWFGVNMLGIGLHSYGFMDKAFWWLLGYIGVQIALIALAYLPPAYWRSPILVKTGATAKPAPTPEGEFGAA